MHVEAEFEFIDWMLFIEPGCVIQLISVIDPRALSCCQISCFGLKLLLLIVLNVSCISLLRYILKVETNKRFISFAAKRTKATA